MEASCSGHACGSGGGVHGPDAVPCTPHAPSARDAGCMGSMRMGRASMHDRAATQLAPVPRHSDHDGSRGITGAVPQRHRCRHATAASLLLLAAAACLLSLPLAAASPKVYIYDLAKWNDAEKHGDVTDSEYGLDQLFGQVLRSRAEYVTDDTAAADFFYVDAWLAWPYETHRLSDAVAELRKLGPWFDRKNGSDHIFVVTADHGRCHYAEEHMLIRNAIVLQHYGAALDGPQFKHRSDDSPLDFWGGDIDRELILMDAIWTDDACASSVVKCTEDAYGRKTPLMCNIPRQDIIVPPAVLERPPTRDCHRCYHGPEHEKAHLTPYLNPEANGRRGSITFFHAGPIGWDDEAFSGGARQTLYQTWNNAVWRRGKPPGDEPEGQQGFLIKDGEMGAKDWPHLWEAKWCLASTATGWSPQFKLAATRGCVPVIMQDGVLSEFEEQLPLQEYSVRIPLHMTYQLNRVLQYLEDKGRHAELQKNLECAWRLHWWRPPHGRALDVVMCELRRRSLLAQGDRSPLKTKMAINFETCTLRCMPGDEEVPLRAASEVVVAG
ncbi:hypothetical protein FOA52_013097 [Chlamydomonas sp. UWO 241]|nr:hypothetical protein FOA52_013097 [Chlamydomonas sp. UWO 241]